MIRPRWCSAFCQFRDWGLALVMGGGVVVTLLASADCTNAAPPTIRRRLGKHSRAKINTDPEPARPFRHWLGFDRRLPSRQLPAWRVRATGRCCGRGGHCMGALAHGWQQDHR